MMIGSALAGAGLLLQAAQMPGASGPVTFADMYGWVYRTGKEIPVDIPAANCLGMKTPQNVYERTWVSPDAKVHSVELSEDKNNPFVVMSVQHSLHAEYFGSFWLSTRDGRLLGACNSPSMYASFVAVKDGSMDAQFESEKAYYLKKFEERGRWDRYVPVERDYP